jgi:hypothetical protein
MAVKEEKYDPGYEAAYGGAYGENPCSSEPCSFSNGLSMFPSMCVCVCVRACARVYAFQRLALVRRRGRVYN